MGQGPPVEVQHWQLGRLGPGLSFSFPQLCTFRAVYSCPCPPCRGIAAWWVNASHYILLAVCFPLNALAKIRRLGLEDCVGASLGVSPPSPDPWYRGLQTCDQSCYHGAAPPLYPWLRLRNPIDPEVHVCICQVRSNIDAWRVDIRGVGTAVTLYFHVPARAKMVRVSCSRQVTQGVFMSGTRGTCAGGLGAGMAWWQ